MDGLAIGFSRPSSNENLEAYIWSDWFAIPQITSSLSGVNDDLTKSEAAVMDKGSSWGKEVQSIRGVTFSWGHRIDLQLHVAIVSFG